MGSQLISNVVRSLFLAMVLTGLLTGSVAEAASYQKTDGTIIDPILDRRDITHYYSGPNLRPNANLTNADLRYADLTSANLDENDCFWKCYLLTLLFISFLKRELNDENEHCNFDWIFVFSFSFCGGLNHKGDWRCLG